MSEKLIPNALGYYKPTSDSRGYLKISLPAEYCRKAKVSEFTSLHAVYDPRDNSLTFTPQLPPEKKRRIT